jgi:hypothetical protein
MRSSFQAMPRHGYFADLAGAYLLSTKESRIVSANQCSLSLWREIFFNRGIASPQDASLGTLSLEKGFQGQR